MVNWSLHYCHMKTNLTKLLVALTLCILLAPRAECQSYFNNGGNIDETRSRHSLGIGIGYLKEWRMNNFDSRFYTPNQGISAALNYNFQVSDHWTLQSFIHFDQVNEDDLSKTYINSAYHFTVARDLLKIDKNIIRIFAGFSFIDEIGYNTTYSEDSNGNFTVRFFNVRKYNTPFASFGIEYLNSITKRFDIGLRLNPYYDFINFGRTDFTGFLRMNLGKK